nr:hypothetical protein [Hymenobacter nivis]
MLNQALSNGDYKVTFDDAKKQLVTDRRFSCCEHQTRAYAFENEALKLGGC